MTKHSIIIITIYLLNELYYCFTVTYNNVDSLFTLNQEYTFSVGLLSKYVFEISNIPRLCLLYELLRKMLPTKHARYM